jgi:hypothetical protein
MGRLSKKYSHVRVIEDSEEGKKGETERERFGGRSGSLGIEVSTSRIFVGNLHAS